jgi:hypothetical protein
MGHFVANGPINASALARYASTTTAAHGAAALTVPKGALDALDEGRAFWEQLVKRAAVNTAKWTDDQKEDLKLHAMLIQSTFNALWRLIEANS